MIEKLRKRIFWTIVASAMVVLAVIVVAYDAVQFYNSEQEKWQMLTVVLSEATRESLYYGGSQGDFDNDNNNEGWQGASQPGGMNGGSGGKANQPGGMNGGPGGKGRRGRRGTAHIVDSLVSDEVSIVRLDSSGEVVEASGFFKDMDQDEQDSLVKALLNKGIQEWQGTDSAESLDSQGTDNEGITELQGIDGENGVVCESKGTVRGMSYLAKSDSTGSYVVMTDAGPDEDVRVLIVISVIGLIAAFGLFALIARKLSRAIAAPVEETIEKEKRFVADASHELKTPVAVISANADVLGKEIGQNKWLGYIKQEAGRMTDLVNQLLQLSRIDYEGGGDAAAVRFDAVEAAMEAALPFESIAYEQGAKYKIKTPKVLPAVGRPDDVKQIIGILIDNAFKHVDKGGQVMLEVQGGNGGNQDAGSGAANERSGQNDSTMMRSGHRGGIVIRVINTGKTIPPDVLPHVFDRFYKEDESREYNAGSFGLGLAIAKALTERNGGEISATSFEGTATFEVKLPQ